MANDLDDEDYYMEDGFMVFTESFLKKRGYCCKSGCRHCPYGFSKLSKFQSSPKTDSQNEES